MKRTVTLGFFLGVLLWGALLTSCDKDPELIKGNEPPDYSSTPTLLVENYVNRLYIDLLGREPLDTEMKRDVLFLREDTLSQTARRELIVRLQSDTSYVAGDSSYKEAYYNRFYNMGKVRMIEGASNAILRQDMNNAFNSAFKDSLNGDSLGRAKSLAAAKKLKKVLKIEEQYEQGEISIDTVFRRLANNAVYDRINMNTFNFIRATFDNMYNRFPTNAEFDKAWEMLENNQSVNLLGMNGQNRGDYLSIVTSSREFYMGLIRWQYKQLLARDPSTTEINRLFDDLYATKNIQKVQQEIMITDEYANFEQ